MKKLVLLLMLACITMLADAQTAIQTSFESTETPAFATGNLHNQNGWALTTATGTTATVGSSAHTGSQAVSLATTASAMVLNKVCYSGTVPGITGVVYADIWVNPATIGTAGFVINGYDLFGGSAKRIFMIEFTVDGTKLIRAFNGSSAVNIGSWVASQWVRISVKADFASEKYNVAINAVVNATDFNFRETYTPTASGTRVANVKEFHSLRLTNNTESSASTSSIAIDDIYVGTDAISDVPFGGSSTIRTITVTQPDFGSITLNPANPPYNLNQSVTATLNLPQGYKNIGWTGDLSGTALVQNFTVTGNMAFSADVEVDPLNPPPLYEVIVTQPANGSITLSPEPAAPGNKYYKETPVTATLSYDACYLFNGWTGDLSGTQNPKNFTVQNDMNIAADVVLNNLPAVKRVVTTVAQFKTALTAMNPGDSIEVNDGSYNFSSYTINRSGCESRPIFIYAKNPGAAILNGSTALIFKDAKYITVKGFLFQSTGISTGIKLENCSKMRITGNTFNYTETGSCTWIYIGDTYASPIPLRSGYNRIDHNIFDGKTQAGNYIKMDGNIDQQTRYDTIDYNWFKNNGPRAANEKESIRVGVSTLSMSSGFTLIEHNLFQDCDGDPEIISVKSCDNTVRYNTFLRCLGTVSLRHGNRSTVEGNFFFGEGKTDGTNGAGGVRVYGKDHKIINNYFSGLTGEKWDAAITITNGDVFNNSTSLSSHYVPENLVVAFNTLVNNFSNIEIGFDNNGNYNKAPINCQLSNNLVVDDQNPIVKSYSAGSLAGVTFNSNMMYPTGSSSVGISYNAAQIVIADPLLFQPACDTPLVNCNLTNAYKVLRLQPGSPAINTATGTYPFAVYDFEGQLRGAAKDIGADEYNGNNPVYISALDSVHVGPDAVNFQYSYLYGTLPVNLLNFAARYVNRKAALQWQVSQQVNVKQYEIEWSSNGLQFTKIGTAVATGTGSQYYEYWHSALVPGNNFYRLKIVDHDAKFAYAPVRIINAGINNSISVYPNPVKQVIRVNISGQLAAGSSLTLVNALGLPVKQFKVNGTGLHSLPVQNIPAGTYRLLMMENGKMSNQVLVTIIN